MNYAYWRKCDFQIHTPRDPNWSGPRPVGIGEVIAETDLPATSEEVDKARDKWADELVTKCVEKGLEAIALTDHHEMVMVPYVQKAIELRKQTDKLCNLWLFPGMELTAHGGVQCLIIFDADLSENWWRQAQGKLGIVYADLEEKASKSPPRVRQLTANYAEIGRLLDEIEGLRNRYIILPNVSQGNSHTVLTDGAHADFRRMPYVGGYLDFGQTWDTLGIKNKRRLSGTDKMWSERAIYPIPTSDSRSADFTTLGKNDTWIKLAIPTAEAIRQAFLGHKSRIRISAPALPSLIIDSITLEGSNILQDTTQRFSPELNSVIGGRGSGKSSLLEYLSFGLGRSCYDLQRAHYSGTQRMHDLVNDTLVSKAGRVTLTIVQDGAKFKVLRGQENAFQPEITYPNGSTQKITTKELRSLFPAVVYSQGELAEIGKQAGQRAQLSDLLQFVNPDFKKDADRLATEIETAKDKVRSAVQTQNENWSLQSKLRKLTTTRDAQKQRVEALEKTLPTLADDDQAVMTYFDKGEIFESRRLQASKHADKIKQQLDQLVSELSSERDLTSELTADTDDVRQKYRSFYQLFVDGINALQLQILEARTEMTNAEQSWVKKFGEARTARDAILKKLSAHKVVTAQIIKLREEIAELTNQIGDVENQLGAAGNTTDTLANAISELRTCSNQRAAQTVQWAKEIERLSSGKIKASVKPEGDIAEIKDGLDVLAAKTGSQETTRIEQLDKKMASTPLSDILDRLRTDCLSLLYWRQMGSSTGEDEPLCEDLMTTLGNTDRVRKALIDKLDAGRVEAIATAVSKPEILLSYCDGSREISFEKASEGQRAAALLFMLLEQEGGPLIIDQPEGDLDNAIIADLTDKLHSAKQNRQLVFASHNANIVVNGSSELLSQLDVNVTGDRHIAYVGAIDAPDICKVITATMEGGEKAFKDRQSKYGY